MAGTVMNVGRLAPEQRANMRFVPKELYVSKNILKSVWKPLEILQNQPLGVEWAKRIGDLPKPSALHVKEGLAYEGKALGFNTALPSRLISRSEYGMLNNFQDPRDHTKFWTDGVNAVIEECWAHLTSRGFVRPPLPRGVKQKAGLAEYKGKNPLYDPPDMVDLQNGFKFFREMLRAGTRQWISPKLATIDLRHTEFLEMGKGASYIELDGLIWVSKAQSPPCGKWIIIELKKGKGKKNTSSAPAEAQQLRKSAMLLRKWTFEILGCVPEVEIYFAAGEAERFNSASDFEFTSEAGNVQEWSPRQIGAAMSSDRHGKLLAYIKTPINLLVGRGAANFLRLNPVRVKALTQAVGPAMRGWNRSSNYLNRVNPTDPAQRNRLKPYIIEQRNGYDLFDIAKFYKNNPNFSALIESHWRPRNRNVLVPNSALGYVRELLDDIHALRIKQAKNLKENKYAERGGANALRAKKESFLNEEAANIRTLLSANISPFVHPTLIGQLRARLREIGRPEAGPLAALTKFRRGLKHQETQPAPPYWAREKHASETKSGVAKPGRWKGGNGGLTLGAMTGKFGFAKVGANVNERGLVSRVRSEALRGKGLPVSYGVINANNVASMSNERVVKVIGLMYSKLAHNYKLGLANSAANRNITRMMNLVRATRGPNSHILPFVEQTRARIAELSSQPPGKAPKAKVGQKRVRAVRAAAPNNNSNNNGAQPATQANIAARRAASAAGRGARSSARASAR